MPVTLGFFSYGGRTWLPYNPSENEMIRSGDGPPPLSAAPFLKIPNDSSRACLECMRLNLRCEKFDNRGMIEEKRKCLDLKKNLFVYEDVACEVKPYLCTNGKVNDAKELLTAVRVAACERFCAPQFAADYSANFERPFAPVEVTKDTLAL